MSAKQGGFGDDIKIAIDTLDGVEDAILRTLPIATEEAAEYIAEGVRRRTPVGKTRRLFESVGVEAVDENARDGDVAYRVVVGEFYGRFLEKGTRYISALGFMSRGVASRRNKAKKMIEAKISTAAGRAVSVRSSRR